MDDAYEIDLTGAIHIKSMDDGDGGELWMKKVNRSVNESNDEKVRDLILDLNHTLFH